MLILFLGRSRRREREREKHGRKKKSDCAMHEQNDSRSKRWERRF
jgi:hypothetical protein